MDRPTSTVQTPPSPPSHIQATSYFSPRSQQCCQCNTTNQTPPPPQQKDTTTTTTTCCSHQPCPSCPRVDSSGNPVIPHAFPADWVCSTCTAVHSVLEILTMKVACGCGKPTLQAVYDQHGRIFLYWRDDPAVYDLTDRAKLQEAAWRVWEAGSEPWLPVVVEVEGRLRREEEEREKKRGLKWNRFSSSSISSEDSLDIEMAGAA